MLLFAERAEFGNRHGASTVCNSGNTIEKMRCGAPRCGFISRSCAVAVAGIKAIGIKARLPKGGGSLDVRIVCRSAHCRFAYFTDMVCLTFRKIRRYACGPAVVAGSGFGYRVWEGVSLFGSRGAKYERRNGNTKIGAGKLRLYVSAWRRGSAMRCNGCLSSLRGFPS